MKEIKIILFIISIIFFSCSKEDQIIAPESLEEEITWDNISGKIVYKKDETLFLVDKASKTVNNFGTCYLSNLKWNKKGNEITGILTSDKVYSLEAYDLNGNHYELDEPSTFNYKYYDWLSDGRLAHITKLGYVYIEDSKLIDYKFNAWGMACSPDGKKIVVSNRDSVENKGRAQLIEIDIATGVKRELVTYYDFLVPIIFFDPVYSPDSKKVLFITCQGNILGSATNSLSITPNILLGNFAGENPDWSPDGSRIICGISSDRNSSIYILVINDVSTAKAIPEGSNPLWIE
jgi:WD40 repeat protein